MEKKIPIRTYVAALYVRTYAIYVIRIRTPSIRIGITTHVRTRNAALRIRIELRMDEMNHLRTYISRSCETYVYV